MAALNILYETAHFSLCQATRYRNPEQSIRYPDMVSLIKTIWRNPVVPGTRLS